MYSVFIVLLLACHVSNKAFIVSLFVFAVNKNIVITINLTIGDVFVNFYNGVLVLLFYTYFEYHCLILCNASFQVPESIS